MRNRLDLRSLETFVAVAEELHFTRAAERVHITQQALSSQVRTLEGVLGVRLFDRTTRRVELTDAGRTLLAHALPLLAAADRAWDAVTAPEAAASEDVSLSYAPTVRRELLTEITEEVRRRRPTVRLGSMETRLGDLPVRQGLVDVTITRAPHTSSDDIRGLRLFESQLGIVLGRLHPLVGAERVRIDELGDEPLKLWPRSSSPAFHDLITGSLVHRGFRGRVEELAVFGAGMLSDDHEACAEIERGAAIGVGFAHQYEMLEPSLSWHPIDPPLTMPMTVFWRREASPAVLDVVAACVHVAHAQGRMDAGAHVEALAALGRLPGPSAVASPAGDKAA